MLKPFYIKCSNRSKWSKRNRVVLTHKTNITRAEANFRSLLTREDAFQTLTQAREYAARANENLQTCSARPALDPALVRMRYERFIKRRIEIDGIDLKAAGCAESVSENAGVRGSQCVGASEGNVHSSDIHDDRLETSNRSGYSHREIESIHDVRRDVNDQKHGLSGPIIENKREKEPKKSELGHGQNADEDATRQHLTGSNLFLDALM
jgi:hypothetical protein